MKKSDILEWLRVSSQCKKKMLKKRQEFDDDKVFVKEHYRKKPKKKEAVVICNRKSKKQASSKGEHTRSKAKQQTLERYLQKKDRATATAVIGTTQALLIDDIVKGCT